METAKMFSTVLTSSFAMLIAVAAGAWACTAQPRVATTTMSGPALSTIDVRGDTFSPGSTVEMRWNSATGPTVGQTVTDSRGAFSVAVTVPGVPPGIYTIVALDDSQAAGRFAFEVTPSLASPAVAGLGASAAGDLWSGFSEDASLAASNQSQAAAPLEAHAPPTAAVFAVSVAAGATALGVGAALVLTRRRRETVAGR